MHTNNEALIQQLQASWSNPDPESFVQCFTSDGTFQDKTYDISVSGHDALRAHARRLKKQNVDLEIEVITCAATDRNGVAEWRFGHKWVGNFDGVDRTGWPIMVQGLSIYEFRDGLISRGTDYWNYMEIIRALKVIPREMRDMAVR